MPSARTIGNRLAPAKFVLFFILLVGAILVGDRLPVAARGGHGWIRFRGRDFPPELRAPVQRQAERDASGSARQ